MDRYPYILGCLLGTALGDAVGLRREGLSPRRAARMYGMEALKPELVFGLGFCSDDTEHTQMVGRALALSDGETEAFQRELARQLRAWLLTLPAGIGLATMRACLKLLAGASPERSGVFSAGNGPAMRSALLGLWADSDEQLRTLVQCCTRITHTDPRAEDGALLIARAARLKVEHFAIEPIDFLTASTQQVVDGELRKLLNQAIEALRESRTPAEFAIAQGWEHGVSGYINQSVPAALYCWAYSPTDFRQCVENAVLLGGDTDSVAAIAGAICGANLGYNALPADWLQSMAEWPRGIDWMKRLAAALSSQLDDDRPIKPPSMHWPTTLARNLVFATVVLGLGFRRLLPPY